MVRLDFFPEIKGAFFDASEITFPAIRVAATPSEIAHEDKELGFRLFHYRLESSSANRISILMVPNIINRPYILDFYNDVSVVRRFCESGFDVYLIDWGYPSLEQREISFLDYAQYVDKSLGIIAGSSTSILGYCTGGIISLIHASLYPERVKNIILLATPVDFSQWYDPRILWGKIFAVRQVTSLFGNVPGELINLFGYYLLARYMPLFLMSHEFAEEFLTYESWRDTWRRVRWLADAPAVPALAYTEFIEGCYQNNLLVRNKLKVDGHPVELSKITCPLLNILARYDHLIPVDSGTALKNVYSGSDYQEIIFPSSHIGLSVGRKAHQELWVKVCDWLRARS